MNFLISMTGEKKIWRQKQPISVFFNILTFSLKFLNHIPILLLK